MAHSKFCTMQIDEIEKGNIIHILWTVSGPRYITSLTTKQRNQTILSRFRYTIFNSERINDEAFAYQILVSKEIVQKDEKLMKDEQMKMKRINHELTYSRFFSGDN